MFVSVDQKPFHRHQQKGTELAALPIDGPEVILFNEQAEEFLREVLSIVAVLHALADVAVERIPIEAAQVFEGFARAGSVLLAGQQHLSPWGGDEAARFQAGELLA